MFYSAGSLAAAILFTACVSQASAQAAPLAIDAAAASLQASAPADLLHVGLGPCYWTKVCVKWSQGYGDYKGYGHCQEWTKKKVCNPGSEKPQQNPPKVHVPPFERRLQLPGPSLGRQGPAFNQGSPSFGRGMQMPGSGASMGRRR